MSLPDFTTTIAIDSEHLPELAAAWPTWVRYRPQILAHPIIVVADHPVTWREITQVMPGVNPQVVRFDWPADWSQREKMLTGLVRAVEWVRTEWYLKLDTDTVAMNGGPDGKWWEDEWFARGADCPVIVGHKWGYTRPSSYVELLDNWASRLTVDLAPDARRIRCGQEPERWIDRTKDRANHRRIQSYVMFGRTDWMRRMWQLCNGRLPSPSQDGFVSYCAERGGWPYVRTNMKAFGWVHCGSSLRRVRERAAEALK